MKPLSRTQFSDQPCGLFRRLLVMTYDAVVIVGLLLLATALAMALGMGKQIAGKDPLYTAYLVLVWFCYLGWCWNKGGMTLGMRAWKVCIKSDSGSHPGWGACAVRFIVSVFSLAVAGLGFVWSMFEAERRTWHDMASHTRLWRC
jgi:uncharacterized RDD family membrane protein YckC